MILITDKGIEMDDLDMPALDDGAESFYTLVPEQGLCLVGDDIVNLKQAAVIRKIEGKTLIYYAGGQEPVILPIRAFDQIRDSVFAFDDDEDEDYDDEE